MKNLLMSVVLITALSFVFLACGGDDDEVTPLSGNVYLSDGWTTEALVAAYPDGHDEATFEWYKDNAPISGASGPSYTPTAVGKYKVYVTSGDETEVSNEVLVGDIAFKGTWKGTNSGNDEEIVIISPTQFKLDTDVTTEGQKEFFYFAITKWETASAFTGVTGGTTVKVTGTTTHHEYADYSSFLMNANATTLRRTNESGTMINTTYTKQ
jgi:hypothetical protein